jgi:hypothetical protein
MQAARSGAVYAASRPIWYPGNDEAVPEYLDGTLAGGTRMRHMQGKQTVKHTLTLAQPNPPPQSPLLLQPALLSLPGDYGFDPLSLGSSPEQLAWNVHAEIFHGRLAMMGVAGILFTSILHSTGSDTPEW